MFKSISVKKFYVLQVVIICIFTVLTMGLFVYMNKQIDQADQAQAEDTKLNHFLIEKYIDHLNWLTALRKHVYEGKTFDKATDPTKCDFGKWYYNHKPTDPEEEKIHKAMEAPHKKLHESALDILKTNDNTHKREILLSTSEPIISAIKEHFDAYKAFIDKKIEKGYEAMDSVTNKTQILVIGLLSLLCAGIIGSYFLVKQKVLNPLKHFSSTMDTISRGDFSIDINISSKDEIGFLAERVRDMVANLRDMIHQITNNAHQVASASEELSATAEDLNRNSQEQSSQTEQVATAMTEMSQTIMEVARNAADAAEISKEAANIANNGKETVERTVQGMLNISETVKTAAGTISELGKSSNEIGNIIRVIDDIADQTNLLALNAAIEAARAGEQGRGFAVVADEVRKLAERTGKATKEIAAMIKKIQAETDMSVESMNRGVIEVEQGVKLAEDAMASLSAIVEAAQKSVDRVQRIAVASEEQSAASEQVSQNMENISDITRKSSAATSQIKQASEELANLASELQKKVEWFKLN